jgi:Tfp pilus assembly protein PilZ
MSGKRVASDKRRSPRIDLHLDVTVKGKEGVQGVRNFSLCGLFLQTEDPLRFTPGDEIVLVMRLPSEDKPVELRGRVVHVSKNGIGVEFLEMPAQDAMSMESCFHIFKGTLPLPRT